MGRILEHGNSYPILDRAKRVKKLQLEQDAGFKAILFCQAG
ncbi:hypothetical protein GWA01_24750 [Gluconobacter wancherniae NBRC 103581]|uniref:Uncharacterized protein n=1 Tax=Gluconobacter wancherniae NBRC 103581 TaxID=656744 RepID=A0A511B2P3_9PROT|nr:hypothetical protein GWA01_24750 [Gluconobacter wancherniae NBRC 103581]